jgi:hypothetical protein
MKCAAASPELLPVTQVQPGGSPSSVDLGDIIGSSFHIGQLTDVGLP